MSVLVELDRMLLMMHTHPAVGRTARQVWQMLRDQCYEMRDKAWATAFLGGDPQDLAALDEFWRGQGIPAGAPSLDAARARLAESAGGEG